MTTRAFIAPVGCALLAGLGACLGGAARASAASAGMQPWVRMEQRTADGRAGEAGVEGPAQASAEGAAGAVPPSSASTAPATEAASTAQPASASAANASSGAPAPSAASAVAGGSPAAQSVAVARPAAATATRAQAPAAEIPLSSEMILGDVARAIVERFSLDGQLDLEFVGLWNPPERVSRNWRVSVTEFPFVAGSSMLVRFKVFADAVQVQDVTVMLRASLWRDAWFAREPLASGSALDTAAVETRRIDCFRTRDALPAGTPDSGLVLTRSIPVGGLLTWRDVGRRPLVRKGEMVEVSAREGMLRVTMKAQALQNGARGDVVTVRNPESLKTIPALVVAENQVEVRL